MTPYNTDHRRQTASGRGWLVGWLGAGAGMLGVIVLALYVGLFWNEQPRVTMTPHANKRIFADERGYVPSLAEYQAVLIEPIVSLPVMTQSSGAREAPGAVRCQLAVLPALALCAPQTTLPQQGGARASGPR